jgi:ZIP family zinc transporter
VPLLLGIAILALAVLLGGVGALFREPRHVGAGAMAMVRTFAVVAAASIALLHLLPEAIAAVGWAALAAAFVGAFGPIALEHAIPSQRARAHADEAPTTALAMGYAAVVAHQAGEGAALASLAETGKLSAAIVLAIAAHTTPLAMVVGIRVLEVRGHDAALGAPADTAGSHRAIGLALLGVASATACGAVAGSAIGAVRLAAVQPWLLAAVAGLLLHALSHDALGTPHVTLGARAGDTLAGWAGLALALVGVEHGTFLDGISWPLRTAGLVVLAGAIAARSFAGRQVPARQHDHP